MGKRLLASMLAVCVAVVLLPGMVLAGTDDGGSTVPSTTASISTTPSAPGDGSADGSLDGDGTPGENAGETTTTTTTTPAAAEPSAAQAIQSRIDALPEADSLSGMDAEQLAQLQKEVSEIYAALDGLAEGKDTLDTAKLDAVSAYFSTAANSSPQRSTVKADGIDTIDKLKAALEAGGTVELTDDITYDTRVDITITQPVTLDLKGHTVEETYGGINHFLMTIKGGSLTLTDSVGGGALIDWGVHFLDIVMYCLGDPRPRTVSGETFCKLGKDIESYAYRNMWAGPPIPGGTYDVEDSVTALIRTEGPTFTLHGAWAQNIDHDEMYIDFMGDKGGIRLKYGANFEVFTSMYGSLVKYEPEFKMNNHFQNEIDAFVRSVRTGERLPSHIDTVAVTARIMQAIYDSAAQHREIVLD